MTPRVLLRKVRSLLRASWFEKLWLLPTWLLLGASRAVILAISFRRLAPRLGAQAGARAWIPLLDDPRAEARARQIARVIRMAAQYTPWESNCFPQAVTARLLLGLYGIPYSLFFGVARDEENGGMKAHAWVAAGRIRVSGGYSFGGFTVVGCFVAPSLAEVVAAPR